jgi:hypothetical protein
MVLATLVNFHDFSFNSYQWQEIMILRLSADQDRCLRYMPGLNTRSHGDNMPLIYEEGSPPLNLRL